MYVHSRNPCDSKQSSSATPFHAYAYKEGTCLVLPALRRDGLNFSEEKWKTFLLRANIVHTQVLFLTITIFGIFMTHFYECKLDCSEWTGCRGHFDLLILSSVNVSYKSIMISQVDM